MPSDVNDTAQLPRLRERLARQGLDRAGDPVVHLARAVAGLPDPVLSHEEARAWLRGYVDAELDGRAASKMYPDLKRHLDLCEECSPEYLELLETALLQDIDAWPAPPHTPRPDLSFLPKFTLTAYVRSLVEELLASFRPALLDSFNGAADAFFEQLASNQGRLTSIQSVSGFARSGHLEAIHILIAAQWTTQVLVDSLAGDDAMAPVATDRLRQIAHAEAERAARQAGLDKKESGDFADRYTALVARDPDLLLELSA